MNISKETYRDKVCGCWAGKCLAGAVGMPFEGVPFQPNLTPEKINVQDVPNDDLELQLVWLVALEKYGVELKSEHLADYWLNDIRHGCDEYSIAIHNMRNGIMPPASGLHSNFFMDGMGAAIRSEIWAAVFPGRPDAAGHFASLDASVDHWGDGVWGEIFLAMAESRLFDGAEMIDALMFAFENLPEAIRLKEALAAVFDLHEQGCSESEAEAVILRRFYHHNFTDCVMNIAFIIYALIWGKGDFIKTILLAVSCGRDTDCTAATCGAVLGICRGSEIIPKELMDKLSPRLTLSDHIVNIAGVPETLAELTERTIALQEKLNNELPEEVYPAYAPYASEKVYGLDKARWLLLDKGEHDIEAIKEKLLKTGVCPEELKEHIIETEGLIFDLSRYARNANRLNLFSFLKVDNPDIEPENVYISATADVGLTLWLDDFRVLNHHSRQLAIPSFHRAEGGAAFHYPLRHGDKKLAHIKLYSCLPPLKCSLMFGNNFNDHLDGFKLDI